MNRKMRIFFLRFSFFVCIIGIGFGGDVGGCREYLSAGIAFFSPLYTAPLQAHSTQVHSTQAHPTFGKTHFIVGQPRTQQLVLKNQEVITDHSEYELAVFFSPDDDVRQYIIDLIAQEQERILVAVFVFTDKQIAQALVDAFDRGVAVELVVDAVALRDRYNKIYMLCDAQIPIFVYGSQNGKVGLPSVMHHKFAVFSKNKNDKSYVLTGSCNFTRSACESNQENVVIFTNKKYAEQFTNQFERLKKRSYCYKKRIHA